VKYYVYELIDPRCDTIFYVGKGKGRRCYAHEKDAQKGLPGEKCDLIREILSQHERVKVNKIAHFSSEREAYDFERLRIEEIGIENLTNIMLGGGPFSDPLLDADKEVVQIECMILKLKHTRMHGNDFTVSMQGTLLFDTKRELEKLKIKVKDIIDRRGCEWIAKQYAQRRVTVEFV
jgi:hypothetical protein